MTEQNQQGQQQGAPNPPPPPPPPRMTIAEKKAAVCTSLQNKFNSEKMRDRLLHLARGDESLIISNLNSFLTILVNDEGSGKGVEKRYLVDATTSSLSLCFLESMQLGIPIDRRGLVHIVVYGMQAELEIDYRGFIYYLSKHYTDADFDIKLVFKGDTFKHWSDNGDDKYEYKQDPGRSKNDYNEVVWAFMYMTYVKNGRERSKLEVMDKRELDLVRSKAKTKYVWDEWLGEMYKKAVCRRACKLPLAAVDENALESVDNKNFELDRPAALDRLEHLINNQEEMLNGEKKNDPKTAGENAPPSPAPDAGSQQPVHEDQGAGDNGIPGPDDMAQDPGVDSPAESGSAAEADGASVQEIAREELSGHEGVTIEAKAEPAPMPSAPPPWDGKTLIIGGKDVVKDFTTPHAAFVYLKKVISQRRHKTSRKEIIAENPRLMAALIQSGQGSAIAELHKLADGGV